MENFGNIPSWFHRDGIDMKPGGMAIYTKVHPSEVLAGNKFAQLQVAQSRQNRGMYKVSWRIQLSPNEFVNAQIRLTSPELENAFALSERLPMASIYASAYKADVSIPGRYTRAGRYLNLPMPGTGLDRDLNLSVYVSEEIQGMIRKFLAETD